MGSVLDLTGGQVYLTPVYGYELPPPLPGRKAPTITAGKYKLPNPKYPSKFRSYSRASTVAKSLEDTEMLAAWQQRQMLIGLQRSVNLQAELDQVILTHAEDQPDDTNVAKSLRTPLNGISLDAQALAGSGRAAEFGTAVHAWCEWYDHGLGHITEVPEAFRAWVIGHRRALARAGLHVDSCYTERIVLNTQYEIAGTLDCLVWCPDGKLRLGDIKTSRGMDYSWMYFAIQMAIYSGAEYMLALDGSGWEPMPAIEQDVALISHLPRERPEESRIQPISLEYGRAALETAVRARELRSAAGKQANTVPCVVGWSSVVEERRAMARHLIEMSHTEEQLAAVWEEYRDIWTDDLTRIGWDSLQSATQRNAMNAQEETHD